MTKSEHKFEFQFNVPSIPKAEFHSFRHILLPKKGNKTGHEEIRWRGADMSLFKKRTQFKLFNRNTKKISVKRVSMWMMIWSKKRKEISEPHYLANPAGMFHR